MTHHVERLYRCVEEKVIQRQSSAECLFSVHHDPPAFPVSALTGEHPTTAVSPPDTIVIFTCSPSVATCGRPAASRSVYTVSNG